MSAVNRPAPVSGEAATSLGTRIEESVGEARLYESVESASQMGRLLIAVLRALFARPITWPREAIVLYSTYARRVLLPMIVSVAGYEIGYAVFFFGGVTSALGVGERFSGALWI